MTELEIEKSKNVQLLTQCVLLRGEIVALKEALARERREEWTRTPGRLRVGEHDADCERSQ